MPFFRLKKIKKQHSKLNVLLILDNFAPLQVRISCWIRIRSEQIGKRALSWASWNESRNGSWNKNWNESRNESLKGSLTLEAAFSLSLFLFLCMCLMMPLKMMDRHRQIQGALEAVGEELSQYGYVIFCDREEVDMERQEEYAGGELLSTAYAAGAVLGQIQSEWVEDVSFAGTRIGPDDVAEIRISYKMRLPFSVFGLDSIPMEQVCRRRIWSGRDGGVTGSDNSWGSEEQEMVYIGKSSVRYHRDRTCHYIFNDLKAVGAGQIGEIRNQDGSRYQPCRTCRPGGKEGVYYVMPYGTSYHTSGSCRAIMSYVQTVPLEEVRYLGACSYCGE